ncbi:sugar phosphate isomerase/epimerase family protein [Christiangramia sp. SM2212]|uniref:Sugar phosphate isomerase/epimerase family protein n=1 Tax=Christiangramia sediminicola TaxID=3073267 RepID=A0ABU1ENN6_9FLAO|nr:sugar phosphate isomerase/epimerase family protein [Christiangramia sp. SM2212]MDR5590006.1 sugar phosphate isomerase/epimerase family protein [Christiangramia sp. SM2212]
MNLKSLKVLSFLFLTTFSLSLTSCKQNADKKAEVAQEENIETSSDSLFFKLSLAEWSLHKTIGEGDLDPMNFAQKASEMGFDGIEYVTGFYAARINEAEDPEAEMKNILDTLKMNSEKYDVENLLLMIDGEGDLAVNDSVARNKAVDNHKKWVDAAEFLGCHSIRVNLFGSDDAEEWKKNSIDALGKLSEYAQTKGVNVLVENHGYLSSDADLLVEVMKGVNMENCGTLPDFGNFCLKRKDGARWNAECVEEYPRYEGVEKMMPYAKAVSAKSYNFNDEGDEDLIDYKKMLQIVKDAGYDGYIGIEYEGEDLSPEEGIMATKDLLIKAGSEL